MFPAPGWGGGTTRSGAGLMVGPPGGSALAHLTPRPPPGPRPVPTDCPAAQSCSLVALVSLSSPQVHLHQLCRRPSSTPNPESIPSHQGNFL